MTPPHILILGGTGDARRLAEHLVARGGLRVTLSLAGRTANPAPQAGHVRSGGFGGAAGLAAWLRANRVDILVDATHPFAVQISRNADAATEETQLPLIVFERPEWQPAAGDTWIEAASIADAAGMLGDVPKTVFLAIGRQELAPFRDFPQHRYVVRSVDPVDPALKLPGARYILDRGPFSEEAERALFSVIGVETIVAKNSGGAAIYAKIAAARTLRLPVVMVRRPQKRRDGAATVEEALREVLHVAGLPMARGE